MYLSTDDTTNNKQLIAEEQNYSLPLEWLDSTGGSNPSFKRSDQFPGTTWPGGNTITLTAGTPYYIEADHTGTNDGDDNLAVTYTMAGSPDPVDGTAPAFSGS